PTRSPSRAFPSMSPGSRRLHSPNRHSASRLGPIEVNRRYLSLLNLLEFVYSPAPPMHPVFRALLLFALCFGPLAYPSDSPPAKLKYGTWGFDLSGMDTKTKPGDDFFRYANGAWLDKTQ